MYVHFAPLDPVLLRRCERAVETALFGVKSHVRQPRKDKAAVVKAQAVTTAKLRAEMGR